MTSTPPGQDASATRPDSNPWNTSYYTSRPMGSLPQGMPPTMKPTMPPTTTPDQTPGYPYRSPLNQLAPAAAGLPGRPSTAFPQTYPGAPTPPSFTGALPFNAGGPPPGVSAMLRPPPLIGATTYNKSLNPGPYAAPQTGTPAAPIGPPGSHAPPPTINQTSMSGSLPLPNRPGPFSAPQTGTPAAPMTPPGSYAPPPMINQTSTSGSLPLLNRPGPFAAPQTGTPAAPMAPPGSHAPPPTINQTSMSGSLPLLNRPGPFSAPQTATPAAPMAPPGSHAPPRTINQTSMSGSLPLPNRGYVAATGQYQNMQGYVGATGQYQNMQGLVEEFQSLSMVAAPGSMESTIDPNALPRPQTGTDDCPLPLAGNCHGRFFRLTCTSLPNSQSLAARWHLPLGAVAHPLAQAPVNEEVPVIDFGSSGIVRCRRCRTYINPFAVFTDNGRRWRCNLCGLHNEVPSEYYCPLDKSGRRTDADERPELSQGSVEFIAPTEYMVRPPMPPVYFFLIDVSSSAIKTGMLQIAVDTIKSCLNNLPGYPRTQIGFLTFDSTLHFYSLKSSLTQPQMLVVADLEDPFLPMPDDLLVNLSESRAVVEVLLTSLPSLFKDNLNVESAVGPALRATFMIMSQLGGKLLLFQSTLPSLGVGRLKIRGDDPHVYGSDKEPSLRTPEDPFYKQMAADFSKFQISVNLYAFADSYMDLASLGTLVKYTGGQVYFYPSFQPHLSGEKFSYELARDLTRETAWEAVLRIRCAKGMRFSTYHGHFMLRSSDLMALPAVDCDKAFAMQLVLEESLMTSQTAYFQTALLYTSSNGERRIRIHTFAAPLTADLNDMYRSADTGAIIMLMSRLALEKALVSKLDEVRQQLVQGRLVRALREYQNMFGVQYPLTGRLIYPESLKLLPLYCLSLYKCLALRGVYGGSTLDERLYASFEMMVMSIPRLLNLLYPTMLRLDDCLAKGEVDHKSILPLPLTTEKLDSRGAFLVSDGLRSLVWLGSVLPVEFVVRLLGMEAAQSGDFSKVAISEQDNDLSKRFVALLRSLRLSNPAIYQQCYIVRQGDQPREGFLVLFNLVEDRTAGTIGYSEWMAQVFKQVKQKG